MVAVVDLDDLRAELLLYPARRVGSILNVCLRIALILSGPRLNSGLPTAFRLDSPLNSSFSPMGDFHRGPQGVIVQTGMSRVILPSEAGQHCGIAGHGTRAMGRRKQRR